MYHQTPDPSFTREGDNPSPDPTPLGAFGASILAIGVPVSFHLRLKHWFSVKKVRFWAKI